MIRQEQSNSNPDLGELIPVPLYPTRNDLIPKPNQDKQKCYQKYRRKVLLTTSSGGSLIRIKNVTFVIDVGVERRKVSNAEQNQDAPNEPCNKLFHRERCRLVQTASKESRIFHTPASQIL